MKIDKDLFIKMLAQRCNFTVADTRYFVDNLIALFGDCIANGGEINVRGFGKLYTQIIPERKGYKPVTRKPGEGEFADYPEAKRVIFRLSKDLRALAKNK